MLTQSIVYEKEQRLKEVSQSVKSHSDRDTKFLLRRRNPGTAFAVCFFFLCRVSVPHEVSIPTELSFWLAALSDHMRHSSPFWKTGGKAPLTQDAQVLRVRERIHC